MCVLSISDCLQEKLHRVQLQSFFPEWMNFYCLSSSAPLPEKLHCSHMKGFSTGWTCESWVKKLLCRRTHTACTWNIFLCATERLSSWMGEHVTLQVTGLCAGKVALFANKKLLSSINQHVSFQLKSTDAWVSTLVSTMGLLSKWWSMCVFKSFVILKERSRWTQELGLSSVCISIVLSSQFSLC